MSETTALVVAIVLLAVALVITVLRVTFRRDRAGGVDVADLAAARAEIARLETALAVETEKASRITVLERELEQERRQVLGSLESKGSIEAHLAAVCETVAARDGTIVSLNERLEHAAEVTRSASAEASMKAEAKRAAEEALATTGAHLAGETRRSEDLASRLETASLELLSARRTVSELREELARLRETLDQEAGKADEKLRFLVQARVEMGDHFKVLAEEVMTRHGEGFAKLNKEQIDGIMTPLRERLGEFEQKIQTAHVESTKERATLGEQVRHLADMGALMGQKTTDLTEALRGRAQVQGAWGEMVLSTILERVGLRLGEEYSIQQTFTDDEGQRLRPDVIIHLPGGQHVVLDSKVSLTAFEELCTGSSDEVARANSMRRHLDSVRSHVATLGSKDYQSVTGGLDYVLMFVPIEGALAAAMTADPTLATFALDRKVTLVTPTTLMIALRTVANVWQVERRNRNAEEIATKAGSLYDKFVGVVADLGAVGDNLGRSQLAYEAAMNKLSTGRGNVVRQLEQIRSMGARVTKRLPERMLTSDTEEPLALADDSEKPIALLPASE